MVKRVQKWTRLGKGICRSGQDMDMRTCRRIGIVSAGLGRVDQESLWEWAGLVKIVQEWERMGLMDWDLKKKPSNTLVNYSWIFHCI